MTQSILRSEWPEPNSSQTQAAFGFHLENYTQWLNSAGAQNRLALGFFDSETGLSRSLEYFRNADVEPVVVESSRDEPVPALVSRHRGTHFNRKLFVVRGLSGPDAQHICRGLESQVHELNRGATWVLLIVDSVDAASNLYRFAPRLIAAVARRLLVLDGHGQTSQPPLPASTLKHWEKSGLICEQIYHTAVTGGLLAGYTDWARLFRSGYGWVVEKSDETSARDWFELWIGVRKLEAQDTLTVDLAEAFGRHSDELSDAERRRLNQHLLPRPICRLALQLDPREHVDQLARIALLGEGPAKLGADWSSQVRQGLAAWSGSPAQCAILESAIAQGAALNGDIDLCESALDEALEHVKETGALELVFELLTVQLKLRVMQGHRLKARQTLDYLEHVALGLHSPLYTGQLSVARGVQEQSVVPLV